MPLSTTIQPIGFYEAKSANHHLSKGRRRATPSRPVASKEKSLPEYLCILQGSDRRKARAHRRAAGAEVKTYRIQLTPEDQKKLQQVLTRFKQRDVQSLFLLLLQEKWLGLD